jgi:PE family
MSYVIAAPELMTSAATDLATIGSNLAAAHTAATAPTVGLIPAAADEVSAAVTSFFSGHAHAFQGLAGKAAAFHDQFVATLKAGAHSYAATEAAATASLRPAAASLNLGSLQGDLASLLRLLPVNIQNFLSTVGLYVSGFAIAALIIGYFLIAWLISSVAYILTNPLQAIPALLTSLGL